VIPPEQAAAAVQKFQAQIQQLTAQVQQLEQENASLTAQVGIKAQEVQIKGYSAETDRLRAVHEVTQPHFVKVSPAA
jgi:multidrug resistance efflux pump